MDGHSDGTSFLDLFASSPCPGTGSGDGLQAYSNGFEGIGAPAEQGEVFDNGPLGNSFSHKDNRVHDREHYATVEVRSAAFAYGPGAMVRGDSGNRDDYGTDAVSFAGGLEIFEHSGGTWAAIATGGGTVPAVNDILSIEAVGTGLEAFVNSSSEVSTTDSSLASGSVGTYCYPNAGGGGSAIGGAIEFGNLTMNPKAMEITKNNVLRNRQGRQARVRRKRLHKIVRR